MTEGQIERFHTKYIPEPNSGCWLWDAAVTTGGYGAFDHTRAHRFSYELHKGPIPKGMFVCHRCDVPGCVNPAHLFLGTALDNNRDTKAKGRCNKARGMRHGAAKFSDATVGAMREMYAAGGVTQAFVGRMFGVSETHAHQLLTGKRRAS